MRTEEVWRRAGWGAIDWCALCEPLSAEAVGTVAPGPRLQARRLAREPAVFRSTAAQAPLPRVQQSRLADEAVVLVIEGGIAATDELELLAWHADTDAWRVDFRLRQVANRGLDPAPARLWVWMALDLGAGPQARQLEFSVAAEARVERFSIGLLR
jgi:hypothetical protein